MNRRVPLVMMHSDEERDVGVAILHDDDGNVTIALSDDAPEFLTENGYGSMVHAALKKDPERLFVTFEVIDP